MSLSFQWPTFLVVGHQALASKVPTLLFKDHPVPVDHGFR